MTLRRALPTSYVFLAIVYQLCVRQAIADISFHEISGTYTKETGNIPLCHDGVEIRAQGNILAAENVIFGGVPCANGEFPLQQRRGLSNWKDFGKNAGGIVVFANGTHNLECWSTNMAQKTILFMKPNKIIRLNFKVLGKFTFLKDIRYFYVAGSDGGCVYRRKLAVAKASASPMSSAEGKQEENGINLWVWLGPVLGGVATIAAAFITVFKCSRRDSKSRETLGNGEEDAH